MKMLNFIKWFSCIYWHEHAIFFIKLLRCVTFIDLFVINPNFKPWEKTHWIMINCLFHVLTEFIYGYLLISIGSIPIKFLCLNLCVCVCVCVCVKIPTELPHRPAHESFNMQEGLQSMSVRVGSVNIVCLYSHHSFVVLVSYKFCLRLTGILFHQSTLCSTELNAPSF